MATTLRLYHVTSTAAAEAILAGGFRDGHGLYLTTEMFSGVWLTDDPVAVCSSCGVAGRVVVEVTLDADPAAFDAAFEFVNEGCEGPPIVGVNYREWLVPADWLKAHGVGTRLVDIERRVGPGARPGAEADPRPSSGSRLRVARDTVRAPGLGPCGHARVAHPTVLP